MTCSSGRLARSALAGFLAGALMIGPASAAPRLGLVAGAVPQGDKPSVAVLVVAMDPALEESVPLVRRRVAEAVDASGLARSLDVGAALDPAGARARADKAGEGVSALRSARAAFNQLDADKTLVEADRAISAFFASDLPAYVPELTEAWTLKIAALAANGEEKKADAETAALLRFDPQVRFSPDLFTPERIAQTEKARKRLGTSGRLDVRTAPPGAEVYVNGVYRGLSPVTVDGLAAGEHVVTAKLAGYRVEQDRTWPGAVELKLRAADGLPRLQSATTGLAGAGADPAKRAEAARAFGVAVGAPTVLAIALRPGEGTAAIQISGERIDVRSGRREAEQSEVAPAATAPEKAADLARALLPGGSAAAVALTEPAPGPRPQDPTRLAGWVLLGASAVALGAGIAFGASANGKANEFYSTPQTDTATSSELASAGRSYALVADVSFVIAVLAGGAGGYLTFVKPPPHAGAPR